MSSFNEIPPVFGYRPTKFSACVLILMSALFSVGALLPSSRYYLALVPGKTIPCIWNVFTSGYLEVTLYDLFINSVSFFFLSRALEPIWGSKQYMRFLIPVNIELCLLSWVSLMASYAFWKDAKLLYETDICGFHGAIAALLVAVKQVRGDAEVTLLKTATLKVDNLPWLYFLASFVVCLVQGQLHKFNFVVFGTLCGWTFLRYRQFHPDTDLRGDSSESFGFETLFPNIGPLRPCIKKGADVFEDLFSLKNIAKEEGGENVTRPLPGSSDEEAMRRRERGAKALQEKLAMRDKASDNKINSSVADDAV